MNNRHIMSVLAALAVGKLAVYGALSTLDVIPGALSDVEGNSADSWPFNSETLSIRYQEVFAASEFGFLTNGGGWIYRMALRTDSTLGYGFTATLPSVQINFSTTSQGPDSLSPVFAENVGPDDMVVLGPGSLSLFGRARAHTHSAAF